VIAERMAAGAHTPAPVTLTSEVDATELVRMRLQLKAERVPGKGQVIPSYTDLLAKIVARALQDHPALNARLEGEGLEDGQLVIESAAHIGIAVDTERGLLVVVVRDVQAKSLLQVAEESQVLIERVRAGKVSAEDLRGSTFTITNLGMYDIDTFSPIINLPECAILGVGRIVPRQVVTLRPGTIDEVERVSVRQMMMLSLTIDHRVVDGAPAARFLQRVKQLVEQPYLWLVS
jgi:pyruvate dehydrogenase E2 component (dihydrolipoamide acetyltransferase)